MQKKAGRNLCEHRPLLVLYMRDSIVNGTGNLTAIDDDFETDRLRTDQILEVRKAEIFLLRLLVENPFN